MKSTTTTLGFLGLLSVSSAAETHLTGAVWAVPTQSHDPYECALANIPHYLTAGPTPTGALASALDSYQKKLYEPCMSARATETTFRVCPVPPRSQLCGFPTAIPTTLLPVYSSYASSAASWWNDGNGEKVVGLVKDCPYLWYDSLLMNIKGGTNLNMTVALAQCWAEAHPTSSAEATTLASTSTQGSSRSVATASTATATSTTGSGGVRSRVDGANSWMVAGCSFGVAAALNLGLL
ncbi:hypothetical protein QBC39DRAFT_342443 [Podospora conica]|nr:hypothetical protein QBC39DRAFT_342443 [Schizothecium conicum]